VHSAYKSSIKLLFFTRIYKITLPTKRIINLTNIRVIITSDLQDIIINELVTIE